ncbi:MAG: hypothetical protein K0A98_12855 [Trueperaceae bacterium]|nr:hypothetical protein [Trueperaceae bacterium]
MTQPATTPIRARAIAAAALLAGALALAGCTARVTFDPSGVAPVSVSTTAAAGFLIVRVPASRPASGIEVRTTGAGTVHIPAGHYPPPGRCRIWRPGVPPGQQEPPGDCGDLERRVPPNAVLVIG